MEFQEKIQTFVDSLFPDLYNVGSEIEKETKNFVSNFLIAYLAYFNPKYNITSYEYEVGDVKLSAYDIKEIMNTFGTIDKLAKILPLKNGENYDNIIVKHAIGRLYKGIYYKEKSFIASFTNAYLFKIGYYSKDQLVSASGTDLRTVDIIISIMNNLDVILHGGTKTSREEVLV